VKLVPSTEEQRAKWRANHHARKEKEAKFYQDHKEEICRRARERNKRPEVKKQKAKYSKNYVQTHRESFNAYHRKWGKEHRSYYRKWARERNRKTKKWAVDKLGRKCDECGLVTEFDCAYDFHHEDRSKSWSKCVKGRGQRGADAIRRRTLILWQKADNIPEDIKLLCATCHRIKHHGDFDD
jgi:hypothetical protein